MSQHETDGTSRLALSERDLDTMGLLSRKTRWRLRRLGKFPEPREVGGRKLYDAQEVLDWWRDSDAWARSHREPSLTTRPYAGGEGGES